MSRASIAQLADALAVAAFDNGRELYKHGTRVVEARKALLDAIEELEVDAVIASEVTDDGKPLNPLFKPNAVRIAREHGMDLGDNPVAYEFFNPASGHAIVDYTRWTHVGHLTEEAGYEARPLVYAAKKSSEAA
jgi:hypothetical protein